MKKLFALLIVGAFFLGSGIEGKADCMEFQFKIVDRNPTACMGSGDDCILRICSYE